MSTFIYADNSATTRLSDNALEKMMPYLKNEYGNPSSLYSFGAEAKRAVDLARTKIADCIHAAVPKEIFFVSCGTEADNWAIKSGAELGKSKGKTKIISSKFEHHAVLHTLDSLKDKEFEIVLLDVHENGIVQPQDLAAVIDDNTALVTIMTANNEIGTIQPIRELTEIAHQHGALFHTDAVQAMGNIPVDVQNLGVDMLSMSAHKFHGPKGVGVLYVKSGIVLPKFMHGGAQERGLRAGTENVAGIVGTAVALKESVDNIPTKTENLLQIRNKLIESFSKIEKTYINGDLENRLPGNVNVSFEGIDGESLLLMMDSAGIMASSGSACSAGSIEASHVLVAIGRSEEVAHSSIRLTFSDENTLDDADYIIQTVPPMVEKLRAISPLWNK